MYGHETMKFIVDPAEKFFLSKSDADASRWYVIGRDKTPGYSRMYLSTGKLEEAVDAYKKFLLHQVRFGSEEVMLDSFDKLLDLGEGGIHG